MLQMQRIEHRIGDVKQLLSPEATDSATWPGVCRGVGTARMPGTTSDAPSMRVRRSRRDLRFGRAMFSEAEKLSEREIAEKAGSRRPRRAENATKPSAEWGY